MRGDEEAETDRADDLGEIERARVWRIDMVEALQDIWACGVTLFVLLCRCYPFGRKDSRRGCRQFFSVCVCVCVSVCVCVGREGGGTAREDSHLARTIPGILSQAITQRGSREGCLNG